MLQGVMEVRKKEREGHRERAREQEEEGGRRRRQRLPLQKKNGQRERKKGGTRSACLGRKGDTGTGQSLSFKGTGYQRDRTGRIIITFSTFSYDKKAMI